MENITAPSGQIFGIQDIHLIRAMHEFGFIKHTDTPFRLKSGIESHIYVFGREDLTDNPYFGRLFAAIIRRKIMELMGKDKRQPIIIGVPTAANGLAASTMVADGVNGQSIGYRVMREQQKKHGAHGGWVNGKPEPTIHWYATIENVVTSGGSLKTAISRIAEDGYPVADMPHIVAVDRQQGGVKALREEGNQIEELYNLLDLTYAYGELGLWPKEAVTQVEQEIKAHQIV